MQVGPGGGVVVIGTLLSSAAPVRQNSRSTEFRTSVVLNHSCYVVLGVDIVKVDALARQKFSKRHFFGDIENSFHEVTHIGLEPHQFFSF